MALAAFGDERTEADLAIVLGSLGFGTPAKQIIRLSRLGYIIQYDSFDLVQLKIALDKGYQIIAFVSADFLPWADFAGFHAVAIVSVTNADVFINDPALSDGPTQITHNGFLLAWEEFDNKAALISR